MPQRENSLSDKHADLEQLLDARGLEPPKRGEARTLQLNIGLRCNLACHHCHVESGPKRHEAMDRRGAARILELLDANPQIEVLDITGGAPELNAHFRFLVREARARSRRVIDRCNLTVFYERGQHDTPSFLADHEVEVVASLPCTTRENVEAQRGRGVFSSSIDALQWLNRLGYGKPGSRLRLDLVYNPSGPSLPPEAEALEAFYRAELKREFGIDFHHLITITNMPIKRFAHDLARAGREAEYMALLASNFNPATLDSLMCRSTISVGHDGRLYDCDFNQALGLEIGLEMGAEVAGDVGSAGARRPTIWDIEDLSLLTGGAIATASHCLGCTAGAGSSCSGALVGRAGEPENEGRGPDRADRGEWAMGIGEEAAG
jgi:radical SAM/Cys-rich protein